jgi:dipeptide/tripeptide permease
MAMPAHASSAGNLPPKDRVLTQLVTLPRSFWMVNLMEMLERLAYYGVRLVIPIYIAQADEPGGLHFTQLQKGEIFFIWAIVQSLVPMFSGGFADRYGYKRTIAASVALKSAGYLLMATQRTFAGFLVGCCVLALGTAIFKPGVQGTMSQSLSTRNSGVGWGTFYMLVNIGGFLGPPLAHFLYGISWPAVFYGCAAIVSLNFLMLLTYREVHPGGTQTGGPLEVVLLTFRNFANMKLVLFVFIMSGFWLMFNQLFDMLPNFIVDWVDSSSMVSALHLPAFMLQLHSERGPQIAQEWLINADSGLIVLAVVPLSWAVSRARRVVSITAGIALTSVGLMVAGSQMSGWMCLSGILLFAVGEMLASPKMLEYLGVIAPEGQKGLYMGYANAPQAIGWGIGSLMGGDAYDRLGDKANLASQYLTSQLHVAGVTREGAFARLMELTHTSAIDATQLLWGAYHPYRLWYQFMAIGIASAAGMLVYSWWVKRFEAPDI